MKILTVEEIREKINSTRKPIVKIAEELGIHHQTLRGFVSGKYNPTYENLIKLSEYFDES